MVNAYKIPAFSLRANPKIDPREFLAFALPHGDGGLEPFGAKKEGAPRPARLPKGSE